MALYTNSAQWLPTPTPTPGPGDACTTLHTQCEEATARELARKIRVQALLMVHRAGSSHIGSCLSVADLLATLYGGLLNVDPTKPNMPGRDRFLMSKGHAAAILYAVLGERGFFPIEWLDTFCEDGSPLGGHVTSHNVPGVEISTGSLGHALPIGCGMALAAKRAGETYRVLALLSDGELDEGSNWEAILFAPHHGLDNLVAIVDYNKIQSFGVVDEVLGLEPLAGKWRAFGWTVHEIDGHDYGQIARSLDKDAREGGKPTVVIAHTTKGKGVSFMEGQLAWHYRSPTDGQLSDALEELGESGGLESAR